MNSFVWQGKDSYIDYGIVINEMPPEIIPEEDTEEIEIKGRDGNLTIDYNAKKSYTLPMECTLLDFTKIDEVKAWLSGSGDLAFNWSNYKYNARLNNKIDISQSLETFGEFPLIWKVQPHKYSTTNALTTLTDFTNSDLVTNGNFTSTAGWTAENGSLTVASNTAIVTGSGTSPSTPLYQQIPIAYASGKKIYIKANMRVTNSVASRIEIYIYSNNFANFVLARSQVTPIVNQYYNFSSLIALPSGWISGDIKIYLVQTYADAATANGKVMEVQQVFALDLTTTFGTGNEPTKAWCDANIIFDSGVIFNPGTATAKPIIKVFCTGDVNLTINSTAIILTNVIDYVTIDSELQDAYHDTQLFNGNMSGDFPILAVGTNTINWSGTVTKIEITPNWRYI